MTERITQRNEHGVVGTPHPMFIQDAIDKLAYFEDLQEQGRLVVLPEEFDVKRFKATIAGRYCPGRFGLKHHACKTGESVKGHDCKECWEKALKGE